MKFIILKLSQLEAAPTTRTNCSDFLQLFLSCTTVSLSGE